MVVCCAPHQSWWLPHQDVASFFSFLIGVCSIWALRPVNIFRFIREKKRLTIFAKNSAGGRAGVICAVSWTCVSGPTLVSSQLLVTFLKTGGSPFNWYESFFGSSQTVTVSWITFEPSWMRRVEPIPSVCSDRNDEWSTFSAQRKIWSNSERTFQTSSIEVEI